VISRSNVDASAYRPETRRSPPRLIILLADFGLPVAAEVCNAAGKLRLDLSERANVFKHLVAAPAQRITNGRSGVSGTRCLRLRFAREHHLAFLCWAKALPVMVNKRLTGWPE
jgi:hypothetical protein